MEDTLIRLVPLPLYFILCWDILAQFCSCSCCCELALAGSGTEVPTASILTVVFSRCGVWGSLSATDGSWRYLHTFHAVDK